MARPLGFQLGGNEATNLRARRAQGLMRAAEVEQVGHEDEEQIQG